MIGKNCKFRLLMRKNGYTLREETGRLPASISGDTIVRVIMRAEIHEVLKHNGVPVWVSPSAARDWAWAAGEEDDVAIIAWKVEDEDSLQAA